MSDRSVTVFMNQSNTDGKMALISFSALELVQGLEQLAINDKNKEMIVEKDGLSIVGRLLHEECSTEEQTYAARSIWQLAFLPENAEIIKAKDALIHDLRHWAKVGNDKLRDACKGALFEIDQKLPRDTEEAASRSYLEPSDSLDDPAEDGDEDCERHPPSSSTHIMISYRWEEPSQSIMREIKNRLKAKGYRVWMDEERMGGNMIEKMARAVENASVVLACVTRGYYESKHCRSEVEYAHCKNKKIVPIKVDPSFEASSWLGLIIANKMFYVMKRVEDVAPKLASIIDKEFAELNIVKDAPIVHKETPDCLMPSASPTPRPCISEWNTDDVRGWLTENNISTHNNRLGDLDGNQLLGLKIHFTSEPNSFYTSMGRHLNVEYLDVFSLLSALTSIDLTINMS